MYEYHGWAVILDSTGEEGSSASSIYARVTQYVELLKPNADVFELKIINGQYHLWLSGLSGGAPTSKYDPVEILQTLGVMAPGSYGLLYVYNDENEHRINAFSVFVLARGSVKEREDPFLSPIIPVVADGCSSFEQ
ncbi:hypothetical protein PCCS19_10030 [Paenibacillus sp. CCS19]|uniref:Imm7 family immunity protein n=1 Tax=Paenibacillus sp. CCS19 TaxID=3158387 RepID=UPI0025639131|nr:Imm7 family immunity protein [Paenibacillus cellulosilyticus]GMK37949.1 hypothetical protein PCCS19_10030 [Paenibacillus cellulosilyticus]